MTLSGKHPPPTNRLPPTRAGRLLGEIHADFMRPIQQLVEAGQAEGTIRSGDARRLARLLHGMILALVFESGPGRLAKVKVEDVDLLVNVFLDGAGKPPETTRKK